MIAFVLCKLVAGLEQAVQQIKNIRGVKDVCFGGWDAILVTESDTRQAERLIVREVRGIHGVQTTKRSSPPIFSSAGR